MDLAGWLPSLLVFSRERPVSDGVLQGSQLKAGLHQDWQLVAIGPCGESCRMSEIMGMAWHGMGSMEGMRAGEVKDNPVSPDVS